MRGQVKVTSKISGITFTITSFYGAVAQLARAIKLYNYQFGQIKFTTEMCRRFDSFLLHKWSTETYFLIGNADENRIAVRVREKFLNYHNQGQAYLTTITI